MSSLSNFCLFVEEYSVLTDAVITGLFYLWTALALLPFEIPSYRLPCNASFSPGFYTSITLAGFLSSLNLYISFYSENTSLSLTFLAALCFMETCTWINCDRKKPTIIGFQSAIVLTVTSYFLVSDVDLLLVFSFVLLTRTASEILLDPR